MPYARLKTQMELHYRLKFRRIILLKQIHKTTTVNRALLLTNISKSSKYPRQLTTAMRAKYQSRVFTRPIESALCSLARNLMGLQLVDKKSCRLRICRWLTSKQCGRNRPLSRDLLLRSKRRLSREETPPGPGRWRQTSDQSSRCRRICRMNCLDWATREIIIGAWWTNRHPKDKIATFKSSKNKWYYNRNNLLELQKINNLVTSPRCLHQVQTINHMRQKTRGIQILRQWETKSQINHTASNNQVSSHPKMLPIIERMARLPRIVLGKIVVFPHHTFRLRTTGLRSHPITK